MSPVFTLGARTCGDEFREFLLEIKAALRPDLNRKTILFYDGSTAHTAGKSQIEIDKDFIGIHIPSHSCDFNSIERVWSVAKA